MTDKTKHTDLDELAKWCECGDQVQTDYAVKKAEEVLDDLEDIFYRLRTLTNPDRSVERLTEATYEAWRNIMVSLSPFPRTWRD